MACEKHPTVPLCVCSLSSALDSCLDKGVPVGTSVNSVRRIHQRKRRRHDSVDVNSGRRSDSRMTQSAIFPSGLHHSGRICKRMSMDDTVLASSSHRSKKRPYLTKNSSNKCLLRVHCPTSSSFDRPSPRLGVIGMKRKRRSRSLSAVQPESPNRDSLSRSASFKDHLSTTCRVFAPSDLVKLDSIGSGFFGDVFRVREIMSGCIMVMKRLRMDRVNPATRCSFLKEASVMRNLNHPNLLKFMGVMFDNGQLNIISEYISGGSLSSLMSPNTPTALSWPTKVNIIRDIACAMAHLHAQNVIHRDLNCHNVLVRRENGAAVVADFGLARLLTASKGSRKRRYTVVGHPYWMAPEMMNERDYDERVDVFSFGICICQLAVDSATADPTSDIVRTGDMGVDAEKLCQRVCGECPSSVVQLALQCCSVDPDVRPDFANILCNIQQLASSYYASCSTSSTSEESGVCNENRFDLKPSHHVSVDNLCPLSSIDESMDSPTSSVRRTSFSQLETRISGPLGKPLFFSDTQDSGHFSSGGSLP